MEGKETDTSDKKHNQTHIDTEFSTDVWPECYTVGVVERKKSINLHTRGHVTYSLHVCERVGYPQNIFMSRTERTVATTMTTPKPIIFSKARNIHTKTTQRG